MRLLSRISARHPIVCLAVVAILTLGLGAALPRLELRTDGAALHPSGDPAVERTARDRLLFQDPEELILLFTARPGGSALTSTSGLRNLAAAHEAVAGLPGVRASEVRSAATPIDVAASGVGSLGTFLDQVPDDRAEREALVRRLRELPWTDGLFLSADGRAAAIYAPLEPGADRRRVLERLDRWLEARDGGPFDLRVTGPVVAEALLGERILEDLARLVPIVVLVVAVLLLVCLRTAGGLLVALSKTLVVLVWTGGLMALAGIPITLVTTILPVLLLALCVTDEVHVLARLQAKLVRESGELHPALLDTLDELRRPVVYTSLSTALGFLSFVSASIVPLRHFGALAAVGLVLAMLMTFTLTPALVVLLPGSWFVPWRPGSSRTRALRPTAASPRVFGAFGTRHHTAGLVTGLLLLAAGVPGLLRLTVQDSWIESFDPEAPLVQAERDFNAAFWGTYRFDLVLTDSAGPSGRRELFHRPEGVALIEAVARASASAPHAGGVVTPLEPLDTVAELLGLSAGVSTLPADALQAVVQVAAEYAQQTGLDRLVTPDGRSARVLVLVNSPDYQRATALAEHVERALRKGELAQRLEDAGVSVHASGDIPLAVATVRAIVRNQLRSIAWTLVGVGLLLLVVSRKPWRTVVQLVPAAAAAWLVLAAMGYVGMPLGVATSMFAALTIGVGVDLALHVTYAYEGARVTGLEPSDAVRAAFERTAAGRRWSTVVLALGFLVLTASAFGPSHDLGILLSAAMLASYLTTSLFVPRMLAP